MVLQVTWQIKAFIFFFFQYNIYVHRIPVDTPNTQNAFALTDSSSCKILILVKKKKQL